MAAEACLVLLAAGILSEHEVGVWRLDGAYEADEVGIVVNAVPDRPASLISLATYPLGDDVDYADSTIGLQVRTRRAGLDPRPVGVLADACFDALHGLAGLDMPDGNRLIDIARTSGTVLGQDSSGRWERTDNYRARVHAPGPHRL